MGVTGVTVGAVVISRRASAAVPPLFLIIHTRNDDESNFCRQRAPVIEIIQCGPTGTQFWQYLLSSSSPKSLSSFNTDGRQLSSGIILMNLLTLNDSFRDFPGITSVDSELFWEGRKTPRRKHQR